MKGQIITEFAANFITSFQQFCEPTSDRHLYILNREQIDAY